MATKKRAAARKKPARRHRKPLSNDPMFQGGHKPRMREMGPEGRRIAAVTDPMFAEVEPVAGPQHPPSVQLLTDGLAKFDTLLDMVGEDLDELEKACARMDGSDGPRSNGEATPEPSSFMGGLSARLTRLSHLGVRTDKIRKRLNALI